jgi:broad specificity phosphatase PhoE
MALTLLRHAPLHPHYQGRYNGWTDLEIDPTRFDAKAVEILTRQKFDLVYSSDLQRCTQTLAYMGIEDVITDERLREVRFKAHIEGKNFEEISRLPSYSESLLENREAWHRYICTESQHSFERRIRSFLSDLPENKEILICSHAGTLQKMLYFLGLSKAKIDYLEWIRIEHGLR